MYRSSAVRNAKGSAKSPLKMGVSLSNPLRTSSWTPSAVEGSRPIGPLVGIRPGGTGSWPARAAGSALKFRLERVVWPDPALPQPASSRSGRAAKHSSATPFHVTEVRPANDHRTESFSVSGYSRVFGDRSTRRGQDRASPGRTASRARDPSGRLPLRGGREPDARPARATIRGSADGGRNRRRNGSAPRR